MSESTALFTDRYELTMLTAALADGTWQRPCIFELFTRRLPGGRRFGTVAGTGRFLELLQDFRFGEQELRFLQDNRVVSPQAIEFLKNYRFRGSISGYQEGELFFPGSPVLTVSGTFADAVIIETLALSVFNHDCAVATAASRMSIAAGTRPLYEMGSRRTAEHSAVAAARAAFIAGFSATSNLAAGRAWAIPTMGTAAHSWTLLHSSEEEAFRSQIAAMGTSTTLLVDTYDIATGVQTAIRVAGTNLGGVRIDSGDLPLVAAEVRAQLDRLGATSTKITVTSDLDEFSIAALAASPVDAYGVGTSVVTGSGHPTAGMVYKLVARQESDGSWQSVAKASANKVSVGGRKYPYRAGRNSVATEERLYLDDSTWPASAHLGEQSAQDDERPLNVLLVDRGETDQQWLGNAGTTTARNHHTKALSELPFQAMALSRSDPAITTTVIQRRTH